MFRIQLGLLALALAGLPSSLAVARPTAPPILCETYPEAASCLGRLPGCDLCHTSTDPTTWNAYGRALNTQILGDFEQELALALKALAATDSDLDGLSNADELERGSNPGDAESAFCEQQVASFQPTTSYSGFDYERALRRVGALYCGRSPTYEQVEGLFEGSPDEATLKQRLHAALDQCLASDYWRDEGLQRIADPLIRPVAPVGQESTIGIVLGDYKYDYRLFAYVLTGDRDARELLTADYHVGEDFKPIEGQISQTTAGQGGTENGTQNLAVSRRAGMITSEWFLLINTMFSDLPRTTAAQAYRGYLGMDLSLQEGIWPVAGEPLDVDGKGVTEAACSQCHSTLDPLSYAFAFYEGIAGPKTGTYNEKRPKQRIDGWDDNQTFLFGEPVADLVAWAKKAAESEAFRRNLAEIFFRHAIGREPGLLDEPGLVAAFQAMPEDGYSANRLLHRLVDLPAFGGLL
jgi:hypothetical protein